MRSICCCFFLLFYKICVESHFHWTHIHRSQHQTPLFPSISRHFPSLSYQYPVISRQYPINIPSFPVNILSISHHFLSMSRHFLSFPFIPRHFPSDLTRKNWLFVSQNIYRRAEYLPLAVQYGCFAVSDRKWKKKSVLYYRDLYCITEIFSKKTSLIGFWTRLFPINQPSVCAHYCPVISYPVSERSYGRFSRKAANLQDQPPMLVGPKKEVLDPTIIINEMWKPARHY